MCVSMKMFTCWEEFFFINSKGNWAPTNLLASLKPRIFWPY